MAGEDRTRHDRLRGLLPRAYATDPKDSALGAILDVLGDLLRDADRDSERALRDRWIATAAGDRSPDAPEDGDAPEEDGPSEDGDDDGSPALPTIELAGLMPLELLGATLDLVRQPWEVDHEAYRSRVRILAPMLAAGLGTPRVILAFALTSLHSEPCPSLEHHGDETRGIGLPPRRLARCRACRGGRVVPAPGTPCPLRETAIMDATVLDNPRTRVELRRRRVAPGEGGAPIRVGSASLYAARPELVVSVPADAASGTSAVVSLRSLDTGEELVIAQPVAPGETLHIRPSSPHDPDTLRHQQVWVDPPAGEAFAPARAWITSDDGGRRNLDIEVVFASRGARFDAGRFVDDGEDHGSQFAGIRIAIETPTLPPGDTTWLYHPLSRSELQNALADVGDAIDEQRLQDLLAAAPEEPCPDPVDITLRWWTRPPARFGLRIPRMPAVAAALEAGAGAYLQRMIDRVRPAGVHPVIDISEPPIREELEPRDALDGLTVRMREPLEPGDRGGPSRLTATLPGDAVAPDHVPGFIGIFDVTRFEISRFSDLTAEPGRFEVTFFDYSLTGALAVEPGACDREYFEWATLNVLVLEPAALDATYFDHARLAP